jgi:hypothetical protein
MRLRQRCVTSLANPLWKPFALSWRGCRTSSRPDTANAQTPWGGSFLGYERSDANAPIVLAALLRWRHRGTFLAAWEDVAKIGTNLVRLRPGYTRYSAVLRETD